MPLSCLGGLWQLLNWLCFAANSTLAQFNKCWVSELHEIAEHYGVPVNTSLRKSDLSSFTGAFGGGRHLLCVYDGQTFWC